MTYTIEDVNHLIPEDLTGSQTAAIEAYLNTRVIPPADPCLSCEPNLIRQYIGRIQKAEREGNWPVKKANTGATPEGIGKVISLSLNPDDPKVEFAEVFEEKAKAAPRKRSK